VLFALLLDRLDAGAAPADAVLDLVADVLGRGRAKLNLLLSDGHSIVATAYRNSLFSLTDAGLASGGVLLASEPLDDDPAWTPVPDGSLVEASAIAVKISPIPSQED
jgi:glutamine amidotransferase